VLAVVLLVFLGICAAWPFRRRDPAPGLPPHKECLVDLALRRPDVAEVSPVSGESPAASLTDADPWTDDPMARRSRPDLESLSPPPLLPRDFGPGGSDLAASRQQWQPVRMKLGQPAMQRHRLTDGDSLESLADRYLGDARRAGEIYEVNRDLLPAADLLPLGRIIRIPPREPADALSPAQR
jgi:nucleoid-associated protein YgaU